jgi:hypothetical protein
LDAARYVGSYEFTPFASPSHHLLSPSWASPADEFEGDSDDETTIEYETDNDTTIEVDAEYDNATSSAKGGGLMILFVSGKGR